MGSFKLRLVTYFMLLSLLPLLAATWAFSEVAERGERGSADSRLSTALRVAAADYADQVQAAARSARSLAAATTVQHALRTHDSESFRLVLSEPGYRAFYSGGKLVAGAEPSKPYAQRSAIVRARGGEVLGKVVVFVPFDAELVQNLQERAALEADDRFALVSDGHVIAPFELRGAVLESLERPDYVELGGTEYRAVEVEPLTDQPAVGLLGLTPRAGIDAAVGDLRERFFLFAVVALVAVGLLAYALGRTIVRSLKQLAEAAAGMARGDFERRVEPGGTDEFARVGHAFNDMAEQLQLRLEELAAERSRFREAVSRFGEVLAATHDPVALLPVLVGSTVEATGAAAGWLVVDGQEIARAGDPAAEGKPLAIPLGQNASEDAVLYLVPAGSDFTNEARELAHWLGSQASVALENARLHRLVERQASTDGLTELANRRHFEETLESEITRAERFDGELALVVADLDDFKAINDRFGHQAGDEVLRTFARLLRETVREIDLPARYGGEEFAVLLPQTDLEGARRLAERLRRAVAARPMSMTPGSLIAVTASFGVAAFPDASTPAALFAAADEALYRAKNQGKNCVICADEGSTVRVGD